MHEFSKRSETKKIITAKRKKIEFVSTHTVFQCSEQSSTWIIRTSDKPEPDFSDLIRPDPKSKNSHRVGSDESDGTPKKII